MKYFNLPLFTLSFCAFSFNSLDNKIQGLNINNDLTQSNTNSKVKSQNTKSLKPIIRTGKHNFTLQWISWEKPGSVLISDIGNDIYTIAGGQRDNKTKDYININGKIKVISKIELSFEGTITYLVSFINNGNICRKNGKYIFKATGTRKYWRLQDMLSCEGDTTDYVDIYF